MKQLESSDPLVHVRQVRARLRELTLHLRRDATLVSDAQARALFETSAEVLDGLGRAFTHFESKDEPAWQK
jgi:hypothetical protein